MANDSAATAKLAVLIDADNAQPSLIEALLAEPVGSIISKQRPDFDARTYGYGKLSDLITATTLFEIERRSSGEDRPRTIHVRNRTRPGKG